MLNMSPGPRRGPGVDWPLIIFWSIILIGVFVLSSCSVPVGGSGGSEECEWELEKRSVSHSLTDVSLTRTYLTGTKPRPRPAAPRMPVVKPKPGKTPVKMPTRKPPKPTKKAPAGSYWEYDCD